jgi:predicted enzyme related to lactoylglutathione lyase
MIKNQIIVDKLTIKTKGDPDMRGFISDILERESEGKHYTKFYSQQIKALAKRAKNKGGSK